MRLRDRTQRAPVDPWSQPPTVATGWPQPYRGRVPPPRWLVVLASVLMVAVVGLTVVIHIAFHGGLSPRSTPTPTEEAAQRFGGVLQPMLANLTALEGQLGTPTAATVSQADRDAVEVRSFDQVLARGSWPPEVRPLVSRLRTDMAQLAGTLGSLHGTGAVWTMTPTWVGGLDALQARCATTMMAVGRALGMAPPGG